LRVYTHTHTCAYTHTHTLIYIHTYYYHIFPGRDPKLQQFNLTIYNTSDNEVLCGYHHDPVYTSITITCPSPLIGRYVHFIRRAQATKDEAAAFCEIVIVGHRYIGKIFVFIIILNISNVATDILR